MKKYLSHRKSTGRYTINSTAHPLRTIVTVAACAVSLTLPNVSNASLLVYDGFETPGDYTAGSTIDGISGGEGNWNGSWTVENGTADAAVDSIPVSGLEQASGKLVTNNPISAAVNVRRTFDSTEFANLGSEVWFSYAFSREEGSNNYNVFISNGNTNRYFGLRSENDPSDEFRATLRFAGSTVEKSASAVTLTNGVDYFVIGKMFFNASGDDRLDVWVNPGDFSSTSALGSSDMFVETANTFTDFVDVWISNGANATYNFDELRIGSELNDVSPIPEPSSLVLMGLAILGLTFLRRSRD